ncbi:MAG: ABC transporter permease [Bacteroidota bacterium]
MLRNYIKIAFRNLSRHKLFSCINIFGLALSMCIGLIVIMRLQDDFSYDRFHPTPERSFRLISDVVTREGYAFRLASTPLPLAPLLKEKYAFVDQVVRLYPGWSGKASSDNKRLDVSVAFTEPSFFKVFGFKLLSGDTALALNEPNKIVLSKTTAERFFNTANPVGKTLDFGTLGSFIVSGVLDNTSQKSHINFDIYGSLNSIPLLEKNGVLPVVTTDWKNLFKGYTYVSLRQGATQKQLVAGLNAITTSFKTTSPQDKSKIVFDLQSITSIAPGEDLGNGIGRGATIGKVAAESIIAFIILLSACFNYTNLSLARSLKRAKEVGVRKVSGAGRRQIFHQFLTEAILISLLSLALAYFMMEFLREYSTLRSEFFIEGTSLSWALAGWFLLFSVFTGVLAGVIPALTLSTFRPVEVLKNLANVQLFGRNGLRKALIVFQFTLSLVIIIFMQTFNKQFDYMATADYGFNRERLINIPLEGTDYRLLKNELATLSGVEQVSATSGNLGRFASGISLVKQSPLEEAIQIRHFDVDDHFVANMGLKIIAGSNIRVAANGAETTVLVNEQSLKALKISSPALAIGKSIFLDDSVKVQIAGVLKDFHFEGFEHSISPMLFRSREKEFQILNVKTKMDEPDAAQLVAGIKAGWKKINPGSELFYAWFDTEFSGGKNAGASISMLGLLAFIGITIACLGLLGMVVYTVEGRSKEVSIRKVMGAGVMSIMSLLSKSFLKLIAIAIAIAVPIGWICSELFLRIFAERVSVGVGVLSLACSFILGLAIIVIGSQVYRVARANPATNLRAE